MENNLKNYIYMFVCIYTKNMVTLLMGYIPMQNKKLKAETGASLTSG